MSGADDPVGDFGKGVRKIYEKYQKAGIQDVTLRLYTGDRHEILNETDRKQVYEDLLEWFEEHRNKMTTENPSAERLTGFRCFYSYLKGMRVKCGTCLCLNFMRGEDSCLSTI